MSQCFAFEKPVVTSNLPAFKRTLEQCNGGFACETKEDYLKNIAAILTDKKLSETLKTHIKDYVAECVGWSKVAQRHIDVYRPVIRVPYGKAKYVFWEDE